MIVGSKFKIFPVALALLLWAGVVLSSPLSAAEESAAGAAEPSQAQIEGLIEKLDDPERRAGLIADLRALLQVMQAGPNDDQAAPDLLSGILEGLAGRIAEIGGDVAQLARNVGEPGAIANWFLAQVQVAERRSLWFSVLIFLGLAVTAGYAVAWIFTRALAGFRRRLEQRERPMLMVRAPLLAMRTLVDIVPLAGFAAAGYIVLAVGGPGRVVDGVVLSAVNAIVIALALIAVARMVFTPLSPSLRLFDMPDGTAAYAFIWTKRLINIPVYGFFAAQVALTLGLPNGGYVSVIKLIGLTEALLMLVLITQIRDAVAATLKGPAETSAEDGNSARLISGLRRRVADVWHILASLYVGVAFLIWAFEIEGGFAYVTAGTVGTALVALLGWGARLGVERGLGRIFKVSDELKSRYPVIAVRANRYLPLARKIANGLIYIAAFLLILQAWQFHVGDWLVSDFGRLVVSRAVNVFFVLALALVVWEVANALITVYLEKTDGDGAQVVRSARSRTLLPLARNALFVLILTMALLTILSELGVNIGPLLAGAGVIGLAIGFGAQTLVKDIITGAFILFEDSISVGDYVTVGGLSGTVEGITIRTIRLRDARATVHTVPFSAIDTVTNMTKDFAYHIAEVGVAYRENTDEVAEILQEVGAEMQNDPQFASDILEPITIDGVDSLGDSAVVVRARLKTVAGSQWRIKRAFNGLVKKRFDARGIEMPFPHQTIYFGEDKDGSAPPVYVAQAAGGVSAAVPEAGGPRTSTVVPPTSETHRDADADADADGSEGGSGGH